MRHGSDNGSRSSGWLSGATATPDDEFARQARLSEQLKDVVARREAIEQAKGMLMMVYNVDSLAAFDLLCWRSQETNVKVSRLAKQIVLDFAGVRHDGDAMPPRSVYDNLLLTAHTRTQADPSDDPEAA